MKKRQSLVPRPQNLGPSRAVKILRQLLTFVKKIKLSSTVYRSSLRSDCRDDANYFFWAAGLSALGTGLLPVRLKLLVSIGTLDLLTLYGRPLGPFYPLAVFSMAAMWLLVMLGL